MHILTADRLIIALDVPHDLQEPGRPIEVADARAVIEELKTAVSFFKIGWPLYLAPGGPNLTHQLARSKDIRVFLDIKFNDIPEATYRLVQRAADSGVEFMTLSGGARSLEAAAAARESTGATNLRLLVVTLLTSMDASDLTETGFSMTLSEFVKYRARIAIQAGCDGVICSSQDVVSVRSEIGESPLVVTPGIRPSGFSQDDHQRFGTPGDAIRAGANYLVMGRPVMRAREPKAVVASVLQEMEAAVATEHSEPLTGESAADA